MGLINLFGNRVGIIANQPVEPFGPAGASIQVDTSGGSGVTVPQGTSQGGMPFPEIQGRAAAEVRQHWLGPCPEGEIVDMWREDPIDNPLGPTRDIIHMIIKCPDVIAGGGGFSSGGGGFGRGGLGGGSGAGGGDGEKWTEEHDELMREANWDCRFGATQEHEGRSDSKYDCCLDSYQKRTIVRTLYDILNSPLIRGNDALRKCLRDAWKKYEVIGCRYYDDDTPYDIWKDFARTEYSEKVLNWLRDSETSNSIYLYPNQRTDKIMLLAALISKCRKYEDNTTRNDLNSARALIDGTGPNTYSFFNCGHVIALVLKERAKDIETFGLDKSISLKDYMTWQCQKGFIVYDSVTEWDLCNGGLYIATREGREFVKDIGSFLELCRIPGEGTDSVDDAVGLQFINRSTLFA